MRIAHQFAPPMSAMLAGLPGITAATHIPQEDRWALPTDVDVLFVLHGQGHDRDEANHAPRPAGWPGGWYGCPGWSAVRQRADPSR